MNEQLMVNAINNSLGNYGTTIDMSTPSYQRQGNDADMKLLVDEIKSGAVDIVIFNNANPLYDSPYGKTLTEALSKVRNKVSFAGVNDETTDICDVVAPTHHFLESWGDIEAKKGHLTLIQPTIAPLFNTRQFELSLLVWAKSASIDLSKEQPYYEYLKESWKAGAFANQSPYSSFQGFWDSVVHDGVFNTGSNSCTVVKARGELGATVAWDEMELED